MDDTDKLKDELERVLASLTPREARVLREKFGINLENVTLENIGEQFDVARTRIREIERKALNSLRDGDPDDAA